MSIPHPVAMPRLRPAVPASSVPERISVRDRLLDTAADLFYREGARAVGVDLVVAESGVAKTSLYRHFASKDELIAAVLERDDERYWANWDRIARLHDDAGEQLTAQVKWMAQYIARPEFRGCAFLNAATEFPEPDHPARVVSLRHKAELRTRLLSLAKQMRVRAADSLADQLVLLIDGAYVHGQLRGKAGPARALSSACASLVTMADRLPLRRQT